MRRSPTRGILAAVALVGTWYSIAEITRDPWLTALAVLLLSAAVAPFFVPTSYRLSEEGVEIRRPWGRRRRPWGDFRAVRSDGRLLVLSPYERPCWLEGLRGETLLLEGRAAEVLAYVEDMVGKEAQPR